MIQQWNEFGDGLGRALSTVISVADDFVSIATVVIPKEKPQRGTTAPGQAHNTNPQAVIAKIVGIPHEATIRAVPTAR
jgi:hypothetical protein